MKRRREINQGDRRKFHLGKMLKRCEKGTMSREKRECSVQRL
jgi:hypothetical protein